MSKPRGQWTAPRKVLFDFTEKMEAAGFPSFLGDEQPDFGRALKKPWCELWFSDGAYKEYENSEYPVQINDVVECYLIAPKSSTQDGWEWLDTCDTALNSLVRIPLDSERNEFLKWDNETIGIDRTSPLKRWDGSLENSAMYRVALISLPIEFYRHYP